MEPFVGRKQELKDLRSLSDAGMACLVTVQGRRRIGKSRLIEEFAKGKQFLSFTGIAPIDGITAQTQRNDFSHRIAQYFGLSEQYHTDWTHAFSYLSTLLSNQQTVILFDEISWMATQDPTFVPKLKAWWDLELQKFPNLILVFCGSISTWLEKNIIRSAEFFGRMALNIELKQLALDECAQLLRIRGFQGSHYDIFKILAVTGGVPRYLEQISSFELADDFIKRLCFRPKGILANDFNFIFHDLFNGHSSTYKKITHILATGMKNLSDIKKAVKNIHDAATGDEIEDVVQNLVTSGFVTSHYAWSIKTEKISEDYLYRLSDNYIRFYIKYIEQNRAEIDAGDYEEPLLANLPGWYSTIGLHVENLLLNNRKALLKSLGIHQADVVAHNPYSQRASTEQAGCQIDYLIQTHDKNLLICEFKFNKTALDGSVITEVQEKIKRFGAPSSFGIMPVLFHVGEVSKAVYDKKYFHKIVNIEDFLSKPE